MSNVLHSVCLLCYRFEEQIPHNPFTPGVVKKAWQKLTDKNILCTFVTEKCSSERTKPTTLLQLLSISVHLIHTKKYKTNTRHGCIKEYEKFDSDFGSVVGSCHRKSDEKLKFKLPFSFLHLYQVVCHALILIW